MVILANYHPNYTEHNMGDALLAVPFIQYLARTNEVYLEMQNKEVFQLLPPDPNIKTIRQMPAGGVDFCFRLSINDVILRWPDRNLNPTDGLFRMFGLPGVAPPAILSPQVYNDDMDYDYVIAPWVYEGNEREWPVDGWTSIIPRLGKVAVIGAKENHPFMLGPHYYSGKSLSLVAHLMKRAKRIVTMESGPSRLVQALGLSSKHYMLAMPWFPRVWIAGPESKLLVADLPSLSPEAVFDFITAT